MTPLLQKKILTLACILWVIQTQAQVTSKAKQLVAKLSIEEKAKIVVGMGMHIPGITALSDKKKDGAANESPAFRLPPMDPEDAKVPEKVPGAAGRTHAISSIQLPSITLSDGPAGVRISPLRSNNPKQTYYATAWPVGTLLASSWDTALVEKVGKAFGNEVKEYGIDVLLAPALNIHRNPLGGRNFEYFSEDPIISGNITAALVNGIESNGVGTSIKHFAANNQETNRNSINTIVSERALREIYLKGFEIAVKKSQPWTVMSSYNYINGTYTSESHDLLTKILRNEWGFKGLVMTDWFGGKDAVAQMKAGNDLIMPGTLPQYTAIVEAVKNGSLSEAVLTQNAERIVNLILESPTYKKYPYSDKPSIQEHAAISRMAASEGMILLKNQMEALPISTKTKVALYGNTSYHLIAGGTGSGDVNKAYSVSLFEGLKKAGFATDALLSNEYSKYIKDALTKQPKPTFIFDVPPPIAEMDIEKGLAEQATNNDIAIITIGRNSGEGQDRKIDNDFTLSSIEKNLIEKIGTAFHAKGKKLVVVLNIGGVIETASWKNIPDAIVLAWQPGMEGGNAITDILSGKTNPSGKLATTFPIAYQDVPSAKNFPGKELNPNEKQMSPLQGKAAEVVYEEGIYVGYRYFNSFHVPVSYPFGFGLSYTNFTYGKPSLQHIKNNQTLKIVVPVSNNGKYAGKEVVQIYVSAPGKSMEKPAEELKAFGKTRLLKSGETQQLSFQLKIADFASFDTPTASWIVEAGNYQVKIGSSATDTKHTVAFTVDKPIIVKKVSNLLVPQVPINELKQ